jgi:hypothetical protein
MTGTTGDRLQGAAGNNDYNHGNGNGHDSSGGRWGFGMTSSVVVPKDI